MIQNPPIDGVVDALSRRVTGRQELLFEPDLADRRESIEAALAGRRVLVVGAAGSIGSATVHQLLRFAPAHLTLVDVAENNLVEVLRAVRSCPWSADAEVEIQPIDYGSAVMERFLASQRPFPVVLNFAAAKHVRSERDVISLLQMVDTNLVKADRFLGWIRKHGHGREGVFFVSSDKAANPANLMGASKRLMEQMLFWHTADQADGVTLADLGARCGPPLPRATTARFANVAFSDGSLPLGFLQRIAKRQPLSGPNDVRRFFLSLQESGQLCTLASLACPASHILIPRLDPVADMHTFAEIAELTLAHFGYRPRPCADEDQARRLEPSREQGWPCFFSASDTMGEKLYEEFVADGEAAAEIGLRSLQAIPHGFSVEPGRLPALFRQLAVMVHDPSSAASKDAIVDLVRQAVPTLNHIASDQCLDRRM
jgi:FlaA1/EpsC-like NDP-sugar epimerase